MNHLTPMKQQEGYVYLCLEERHEWHCGSSPLGCAPKNAESLDAYVCTVRCTFEAWWCGLSSPTCLSCNQQRTGSRGLYSVALVSSVGPFCILDFVRLQRSGVGYLPPLALTTGGNLFSRLRQCAFVSLICSCFLSRERLRVQKL